MKWIAIVAAVFLLGCAGMTNNTQNCKLELMHEDGNHVTTFPLQGQECRDLENGCNDADNPIKDCLKSTLTSRTGQSYFIR